MMTAAAAPAGGAPASGDVWILRWPGGGQGLRVQGALVDLDGTLVHTLGDFDAALNAMLAELGQPPIPREQIAHLVGKGSENLVRQTLLQVRQPQPAGASVARAGAHADAAGDAPAKERTDTLEPAWFERALASYQRHYGQINGRHSTIYAGAQPALARLHAAGLPMVCLTNKPQRHAEALLAALDLRRYFVAVFGGDAFARKKPDPLPLVEAARTLGLAPDAVVMLGDSANDAQAAHAAGCPVLLVEYGYNHGQPIAQVPADGYLARLDQLQVQKAS